MPELKTILVTGSNAGIGFELVRLLAKGNVVYMASRNESAGKEAQEKLKKEGLNVNLVQLDVTDINSITAARDTIEKAEGKLDVLVNNAGTGLFNKPQNATNVDVAVVREAFEPNFFGLIQTTTTFLPLLRKSSQAVILNVSTDMASTTTQAKPNSILHVVAYNTSKAAANSYTVALAHELRHEGIKVNCVTPGFTTTKLNSYRDGGKTAMAGAEVLLPWALLGADGPTGLFIDETGKELAW